MGSKQSSFDQLAMSNNDDPDIDFIYTDCDTHPAELGELYSYTENNDFNLNRTCWEELMVKWSASKPWKSMELVEKDVIFERISEGLELSDREQRFKYLRALLYLLQGVFGEADRPEDVLIEVRKNVFLLYQRNFFPLLVQLLVMEIESGLASMNMRRNPMNMKDSDSFSISMKDSTDLRVILNSLYIFLEVMRTDPENEEEEELRKAFREELSNPISTSHELFAITLFQMAMKFCNGYAPHFPVKKVVLLLWKTILVTLGGMDELRELKNHYRSRVGLPPVPDDTLEVSRTMRPSSPPMIVQANLVSGPKRRRMRQRMIIKQDALIGDEQDVEESGEPNGDSDQMKEDSENNENDQDSGEKNEEEKVDIGPRPASPRSSQPRVEYEDNDNNSDVPIVHRGLPWWPKVRYKDIDLFLFQTRSKFIGFDIPEDRETTAGLPAPILEGLKVLKKHLYVSLSELQMRREEEMAKYPLTLEEIDLEPLQSPAEALYKAALPNLPQYMIALLKILLAAAPISKPKTESINIGTEIVPELAPTTVVDSMKFHIDFNRHKEIIIKAVSAILILILKHFKINHVYQFEHITQQLVYANCIPLILKIFNQNVLAYIIARNNICVLDYPSCVVGEPVELNNENDLAYSASSQNFPSRNIFSCINMVRILNKLTKWKYARIMMLVLFKSSAILKKALRVKQALFQLYILKLLKMQTKYLGRQWRKSNMRTLSCIYQMVRHRLTDDWAFGNEMEQTPWDLQNDEFNMQAKISRFHSRRYSESPTIDAFSSNLLHTAAAGQPNGPMSPCHDSLNGNLVYAAQLELSRPVDNNFSSVLSKQYKLTGEFKKNYEAWLHREVFQFNIDWDQLLVQTNTSTM